MSQQPLNQPHPPLNEFQQQALDAMAKQQEAYLALVREWKSSASAGSPAPAEAPAPPAFTVPGFPGAGAAPAADELAAQQQEFLTQLAKAQQSFIAALNEIWGQGR